MKKSILIIIIIASAIALLGAVLIGVGFAMGGDFNRDRFSRVTHSAEGEFDKISIQTASTDIGIRLSQNGKAYAICDESEKMGYTVAVEDGTLVLKDNDRRSWTDYIGIGIGTGRAVLYLPEGEYTSLEIKTASGEIICNERRLSFGKAEFNSNSGEIEFSANIKGELSGESSSGDMSFSRMEPKNIKLSSSSGEIGLEDISVSSGLTVKTSSGEIELENAVAAGTLELSSSSGDIELSRCDGGDIVIKSSSGRVRASLLTDKLFEVKSSSGKIKCPPSIKGSGKCSIVTSSGNITVVIGDSDD